MASFTGTISIAGLAKMGAAASFTGAGQGLILFGIIVALCLLAGLVIYALMKDAGVDLTDDITINDIQKLTA